MKGGGGMGGLGGGGEGRGGGGGREEKKEEEKIVLSLSQVHHGNCEQLQQETFELNNNIQQYAA